MIRIHTSRKRIAIRLILCIQTTGFFYDNISYGWSYPIKEIAKPECKQNHRSTLANDCKIPLPTIAKANYNAYKENQTMRLIYSVLRGASYSSPWDMTKGAHEGVDITSAEGTPIYAIEDGSVIKARAAIGYGNVVTIKHTMADKSVYYSIYGHLEKVIVQEGKKVTEGQQIGTMGHEGMAFGNHLHFAINKTPDNVYAFYGCLDYPKTSDLDIVEKGLCRDLLFARTVDPIAFIETNGLVPSTPTVSSVIAKTTKTSIIAQLKEKGTTTRKIIALTPTSVTAKTTSTVTTTKIPTPVTNQQQTTKVTALSPAGSSITSQTAGATDDFLKKYTVTVTSNFGSTLKKGGSSSIGIVVKDGAGKEYTGVLDKEISLTPSKQNVLLSPRIIRYINTGKAVSLIEAKESGSTEIIVSYGTTVIGKILVTVQ